MLICILGKVRQEVTLMSNLYAYHEAATSHRLVYLSNKDRKL